MDIYENDFMKAIEDYLYFEERRYPHKALMKIIGDRYRLTAIQRTILMRGVYPIGTNRKRQEKLTGSDTLYNESIYIDGFNILITIISYLKGNPVFICTDGFLRDASESRGRIFRSDLLDKAINMVFQFLGDQNPERIFFLFDKPVSNSGMISSLINRHLKLHNLSGRAYTCGSPDHELIQLSEGICATSDSVIIDNCLVPLFDLSRHVLSYHYNPSFITLAVSGSDQY